MGLGQYTFSNTEAEEVPEIVDHKERDYSYSDIVRWGWNWQDVVAQMFVTEVIVQLRSRGLLVDCIAW